MQSLNLNLSLAEDTVYNSAIKGSFVAVFIALLFLAFGGFADMESLKCVVITLIAGGIAGVFSRALMDGDASNSTKLAVLIFIVGFCVGILLTTWNGSVFVSQQNELKDLGVLSLFGLLCGLFTAFISFIVESVISFVNGDSRNRLNENLRDLMAGDVFFYIGYTLAILTAVNWLQAIVVLFFPWQGLLIILLGCYGWDVVWTGTEWIGGKLGILEKNEPPDQTLKQEKE